MCQDRFHRFNALANHINTLNILLILIYDIYNDNNNPNNGIMLNVSKLHCGLRLSSTPLQWEIRWKWRPWWALDVQINKQKPRGVAGRGNKRRELPLLSFHLRSHFLLHLHDIQTCTVSFQLNWYECLDNLLKKKKDCIRKLWKIML